MPRQPLARWRGNAGEGVFRGVHRYQHEDAGDAKPVAQAAEIVLHVKDDRVIGEIRNLPGTKNGQYVRKKDEQPEHEMMLGRPAVV